MGPTRPPIGIMGAITPEYIGWSVNPTTLLQLVPRLRMSGAKHPLPHTPSPLPLVYQARQKTQH
jgi:hypothetical protein